MGDVPSTLQALLLVGLVSVEAVVLYAGYGIVERRVAPSVLEAIESS